MSHPVLDEEYLRRNEREVRTGAASSSGRVLKCCFNECATLAVEAAVSLCKKQKPSELGGGKEGIKMSTSVTK